MLDEDGEHSPEDLARFEPSGGALDPIALSAERALEELLRDKAVGVPLTSLSVSSVGSRLTNSFCSNCTTTYGRALTEETFSPRACMSLTCICPLEELAVAVDVEPVEELDEADDEDGVEDLFVPDLRCLEGGGCRILKLGA